MKLFMGSFSTRRDVIFQKVICNFHYFQPFTSKIFFNEFSTSVKRSLKISLLKSFMGQESSYIKIITYNRDGSIPPSQSRLEFPPCDEVETCKTTFRKRKIWLNNFK